MASTVEIKGSRRTSVEGKQYMAEKLYVSDDGTTDVPAAGADYESESEVTGRKCVRADVEPEIIPGIYLVRVQYRGFVAYA